MLSPSPDSKGYAKPLPFYLSADGQRSAQYQSHADNTDTMKSSTAVLRRLPALCPAPAVLSGPATVRQLSTSRLNAAEKGFLSSFFEKKVTYCY